MELSNGLEWVDWTDDLVQVVLCDHCGASGCSSGGYVRVRRAGDGVLWTAPPVDPHDEFDVARFSVPYALEDGGAAYFPADAWDAVRARVPSVPPMDALPPASRRDLLAAWLLETRANLRAEEPERLTRWLEPRPLGCDTLDADEALSLVRRLLAWTREAPSAVVDRALRAPEEVGAEVETLCFEGPAALDWPALARLDGGWTLAFGPERVLVGDDGPLLR